MSHLLLHLVPLYEYAFYDVTFACSDLEQPFPLLSWLPVIPSLSQPHYYPVYFFEEILRIFMLGPREMAQ